MSYQFKLDDFVELTISPQFDFISETEIQVLSYKTDILSEDYNTYPVHRDMNISVIDLIIFVNNVIFIFMKK